MGIPDTESLLYLQRTAGNAAVASLFESRGSVAVQRCAGADCNCPPEERLAHEQPLPVQRGLLDTLAEGATSLLPDSIKSVVTGSSGQATATVGELREKGAAVSGHAHDQGATALEHHTASAEATASSADGQMRSHTEQTQSHSSEAIGTGKVDADRAETATQNLGSIGSFAEDLVNPVGPIVALPEFQNAIQHVGSVLAAVPGGLSDLGSNLKTAVTDGLKKGQTSGWDCDQSEIMAMVGGVSHAVTSAAVKAGKKVFGEERYEALAGWAHDRVGDLKEVGAAIRAEFEAAKTALQDFWTAHVTPLIKRLQGLVQELGKLKDRLVAWAGEQFEKVKQLAAAAWKSIRTSMIEPVVAFAHAAKDRVTKLVADARAAIGSWWDHLPDLAKKAITGLGAAIAAPFALALAGAEKAEHVLAGLAESLARRLKQLSDSVLRAIAKMYRSIRPIVSKAIDGFKKAWHAIKSKAGGFLQAAYARVDAATGGRVSKLMAGLGAMKRKISGVACTALGAAAGPCLEQFVPNPGKGEEADVTLTSNADVTVPVYGVPVKIGRGSSIKLSRKDRKYTATQSGEGLIAVVLPKAGGGNGPGGFSLDVSGPLGTGAAWKTLTGKDIEPGPKAKAGGGGVGPEAKEGPEVEGEAGYKATVDMAYDFDASAGKDTTCDGLGGLTAFLGAQGLSEVLPQPFSGIAGGAVTSFYAENLSSCIVALIQYGKASVNLKQDGIGGLEAAIKGQSKVALERTKDEKEGWIDTASLSQSLGISGAAKLATGGDLKLNLSTEAGATGTLFAKLKYAESTDRITALAAGAKLALSLELDPGKIKAVLPASVSASVLPQIVPYVKAGQPGSLEVEASYQVTNLQDLVEAVDSYLNQTSADAVSTDGLFKVVTDYLATATIKEELTVKLNTTRSITKVGAEIDVKEVGGKFGVELVEHHSRTIYSYPAGAGSE